MAYRPIAPNTFSLQLFKDIPLKELSAYIDWSPFFLSWEMRGKYPAIFDDPLYGSEAKKLFEDAQEILSILINDGKLHANAVCRILPAQSKNDDDIVLYADDTRKEVIETLCFLRQQHAKATNQPHLCLADFIAPISSGIPDYLGAFVVTAGIGCEDICKHYEDLHDDYSSILVKAIADRLAEATAEWLHEKVRKEIWGFAKDEHLTNEQLIGEHYQGIRPAPGYPACPDHTEKAKLFALLNATESIGVTLTESYAMMPAASVAGWFFAHPEAKYFTIGKITRDQVEHYAQRKGMTIQEVERWLSPIIP